MLTTAPFAIGADDAKHSLSVGRENKKGRSRGLQNFIVMTRWVLSPPRCSLCGSKLSLTNLLPL